MKRHKANREIITRGEAGTGTLNLLEAMGPFCFVWPVTLIGPYCVLKQRNAESGTGLRM